MAAEDFWVTTMITRLHVNARGVVQGVGFRPFVYHLATSLNLNGWVSNGGEGVVIEVEGDRSALDTFLAELREKKPLHSYIQSLEPRFLDPVGYRSFSIRKSDKSGRISTLILPDIATCPECVAEIFDPSCRRYNYPFTNCTHCGPRFSIIEGLPYDRVNTTMRPFAMCPECRREYEDPDDRRFHAQPIACPACGPHLTLWDSTGSVLASRHEALLSTAASLLGGGIIAIKGLGGFQILVDARNEDAIKRLRQRKHRKEKPFAVLFPTMSSLLNECETTGLEQDLLVAPESPIVLLNRRQERRLLPEILAPHNPRIGAMLPYTPLHHLLMREVGVPVVATSGNISDEPICIDQHEALVRLSGVADYFLVHDREIVRHADDSVVQVVLAREQILRRARGYAPLPIDIHDDGHEVLAVGAHLKNSIAISHEGHAFLSQHIGDLETYEAQAAFRQVIGDLQRLLRAKAQRIVCDLHPDYISSQFAAESGLPWTPIQHHIAHVTSCMADNNVTGDVLGVSWDGTGYGLDGTIWGGEFFSISDGTARRVATLRPFMLPGGDSAVAEPRRVAVGLLHDEPSLLRYAGKYAPIRSFDNNEFRTIRKMLHQGINSPRCSSVGRLFDAVASILDIRHKNEFEGQAAMELEFNADRSGVGLYPSMIVRTDGNERDGHPGYLDVIDWAPVIDGILEDITNNVSVGRIAWKFHNTLATIIVNIARRNPLQRVMLSGGCFQNRLLTELTVRSLTDAGFRPYWHQRVPPNDGGIALGQIVAAGSSQVSRRIRTTLRKRETVEEELVE